MGIAFISRVGLSHTGCGYIPRPNDPNRDAVGRVIAIANQKGGVGKTTTAVNLATSLAAAQKKTLLIDFDPQGNATSGAGIDKERIEKSIYHALIGEASIEETILEVEPDSLRGFL